MRYSQLPAPAPTVRKIETTAAPERPRAPEFLNQNVVRSDGRSDWRLETAGDAPFVCVLESVPSDHDTYRDFLKAEDYSKVAFAAGYGRPRSGQTPERKPRVKPDAI